MYYRVSRIMKYTETVYVEADSIEEANEKSGSAKSESNHDDHWYDSEATVIDKAEYEAETK